MMLMGQTADGQFMSATRYRIKPKTFQDYYFVRGEGSLPTEVTLHNKTGEPITVFFYNPNDKVRGVARFSRKLGVNGQATAPIGGYYIVVKQDKAFGKKITEGDIHHARVFVYTPHRGGLDNHDPVESLQVTFNNQAPEDLRIFIYNAKDAVRAVGKKSIDIDANQSYVWEEADDDFRYKLFERRLLDRLEIDGRSTGFATLNLYRAPTRGYSRFQAIEAVGLDGMPEVMRGLGGTTLDGAPIDTLKSMFGRTTTGELVRIVYTTESTTPLRLVGPVKTSWRVPRGEADGLTSPFTSPFTQAPSVAEVSIRDLNRLGGEGADVLAEVAFGTNAEGLLVWGYITAERNATGLSSWLSAEEVKWVDLTNTDAKSIKRGFTQGAAVDVSDAAGSEVTVLAVKDNGDLHVGEFQVKPGKGTGFQLDGDGGVFTRWEVTPGDYVGRPAAMYWGGYDLYAVVRTKDNQLMYAMRPTERGRDGTKIGSWTTWKKIADNAVSDPQTYLGGGQLYVAYRRTDGGHALIQYDVKKNEVVRNETNHGNKFVAGPVLMVNSNN